MSHAPSSLFRFIACATVVMTSASDPLPTAGAVPAAGTIPVSPGGDNAPLAVVSECPTFSWAATGAGGGGFELAVYALEPDGSLDDSPALRIDLPAGSSSYTPSGWRCLGAGRYAWVVRGRGRAQESAATWPAPLFFSVAPPSEELERVVERVLQRMALTGQLPVVAQGPTAGRPGVSEAIENPAPLARLTAESFSPPACDPEDVRIFSDVPNANLACPWIEQLYVDGITDGCATGPLRFCPQDPVRREQLAAIVGKAVHDHRSFSEWSVVSNQIIAIPTSGCTNAGGLQVTIEAPLAGRIVVQGRAIYSFGHTNGTMDHINTFIGVNATDCPVDYGLADVTTIPPADPTAPSVLRTAHATRVFDVAPGTYTYYLNPRQAAGGGDDSFFHGSLVATFYPH